MPRLPCNPVLFYTKINSKLQWEVARNILSKLKTGVYILQNNKPPRGGGLISW